MGCIIGKSDDEKPPLVRLRDCCKDIKCKSNCYSSCCMFSSNAKNTVHRHHHKIKKDPDNSNDTTSTPERKL